MARGRPKKYDEPIANPNKERLRQLAASIEHIDGEIAELRKDRSEYMKSAKEAQIKTDVLTSCIKLAKMDAGARQLWLDCFDQYRIDLELDNMASALQDQTELEDAIAKAPPKANGNGKPKVGKGDAKAALAAAQQHLGTAEPAGAA